MKKYLVLISLIVVSTLSLNLQAQQKSSYYSKLGFALFEPIDDGFRETYPLAIGYKVEGGKYINDEIRAGIGATWMGIGKDSDHDKNKLSMSGISAQIEWVPKGSNGRDWFTVGVAGKMRTLKVKYEDGDEESEDGFGLSPRIGLNAYLSEKLSLYFDLDYELINNSEEINMGGLILTIGLRIK